MTDDRGEGIEGIAFNSDSKFDLQLSAALVAERRLAEIFAAGKLQRVELKTETYQWEATGNICVEYRDGERPSGIAATQADYWVHELRRDGKTLCYLMFPTERLKELARRAYEAGHYRVGVGDQGRMSVVLIGLEDILK